MLLCRKKEDSFDFSETVRDFARPKENTKKQLTKQKMNAIIAEHIAEDSRCREA